MNPIASAFVLVNALALLVLPRRWAPLPLLAGACYMTLGQGIDAGPFTFTVVRMLVAAGVVRVLLRGERLADGMNTLDWLMVAWGVWACASLAVHDDVESGIIFRLGLVYNCWGVYFLLRIFCRSLDDVVGLCRITAILLIPVAVEMLSEEVTAYNLFSVFGGVQVTPQIREGRFRISGPFAHPILAGTVGAVTLPLMMGIWGRHRTIALSGAVACVVMTIVSASSGPFMSALAGIAALLMWRNRFGMRAFRWMAVFAYIALDLVMKAPAYYLIARVDVAGGSTGWHRARLIEASLAHLGEWWLAGTNFTRHWMPTGVSWSPNHTDITNHYLYFGVLGGLPMMFLFIASLAKAFAFVGQRLRSEGSEADHFTMWALGAALFAHAATSISVSYFDQSFLFLYLTLAAIGSARSEQSSRKVVRQAVSVDQQQVRSSIIPGRRVRAYAARTWPGRPMPSRSVLQSSR